MRHYGIAGRGQGFRQAERGHGHGTAQAYLPAAAGQGQQGGRGGGPVLVNLGGEAVGAQRLGGVLQSLQVRGAQMLFHSRILAKKKAGRAPRFFSRLAA